jgi:hypothetical protein
LNFSAAAPLPLVVLDAPAPSPTMPEEFNETVGSLNLLWLFIGMVFIVGAFAGWHLSKAWITKKHRKELSTWQSKFDLLINTKVGSSDIWILEARPVYHLQEHCGSTGARSSPIVKKSCCKTCLKTLGKIPGDDRARTQHIE